MLLVFPIFAIKRVQYRNTLAHVAFAPTPQIQGDWSLGCNNLPAISMQGLMMVMGLNSHQHPTLPVPPAIKYNILVYYFLMGRSPKER